MKTQIENEQFNRLINHGPVLLLSTAWKGKPNAMAIAWHTALSKDPPLLGIAVSRKNYSCRLINESGEFVLNVPARSLLEEVQFCGTHHGNDVDKFKETGLTPVQGGTVLAPHIEQCIGHIECRVSQEIEAGDHSFFISEVKLVVVEEELFDGVWTIDNEDLLTVHHLGGKFYAPTGPTIKV